MVGIILATIIWEIPTMIGRITGVIISIMVEIATCSIIVTVAATMVATTSQIVS
jgi:hypothetical protein